MLSVPDTETPDLGYGFSQRCVYPLRVPLCEGHCGASLTGTHNADVAAGFVILGFGDNLERSTLSRSREEDLFRRSQCPSSLDLLLLP